MTRLVIVGAGGHGAVVAEAAVETGRWSDIVFVDEQRPSSEILGHEVIRQSDFSALIADGKCQAIVAIGDNRKRLALAREIAEHGGKLVSVIHPSAVISRSASVGPGSVVCAAAVVSARASIGTACIINTAGTIDHDCAIGDGAHVSPGGNLAGNVHVGECAWIGIGASVREGISIGDEATIGAGSAVVADVTPNATVGGVPAKILR